MLKACQVSSAVAVAVPTCTYVEESFGSVITPIKSLLSFALFVLIIKLTCRVLTAMF